MFWFFKNAYLIDMGKPRAQKPIALSDHETKELVR